MIIHHRVSCRDFRERMASLRDELMAALKSEVEAVQRAQHGEGKDDDGNDN